VSARPDDDRGAGTIVMLSLVAAAVYGFGMGVLVGIVFFL
jgi:hypothetical protein